MIRSIGVFALFIVVGLLHAGESTKAGAAKKTATELASAMLKGEHAKVVDRTFDKIVEMAGGREKMIGRIGELAKAMEAKGVKFHALNVGEPGDVLTEGKFTFVVVPTVMVMRVPSATLTAKSFLLGISLDDGKHWKFVEGAKVGDKAAREKVLPPLPVQLKLPAMEQPVIERDK
ncbi:MAG: hypothetical protein EXS16_03220 [Gemmataceae bacterium]|nr:hypothetical protein [Gemmataceae bacterium]